MSDYEMLIEAESYNSLLLVTRFRGVFLFVLIYEEMTEHMFEHSYFVQVKRDIIIYVEYVQNTPC